MTQATMGPVYLKVANLEQQLAFYQDIIGLQVQSREGDTACLGAGGDDLLVLTEVPDGRRVQGTTGLYHFAILVPSRYDLARSLKRIAETRTPIQGLSDHFVSEAIYLPDTEGNGIEIYADRPRSAWYESGQFKMGTVAMDVDGVMGELQHEDVEWTGLHPNTIMGHVHLHVASVSEAEAFYTKMLGLDVMAHWHSATFLSYDGYHHHLGANTWGGRTLAPPDALGLDKYVVRLADNAMLEGILARLDEAGIPFERQNGEALVSDPSQNRVALTVASD